MPRDNFRRSLTNISTHISSASDKVKDKTFSAYVVDVIYDPKKVSEDRKNIILKFLQHKEAFDYLPPKSVIFAKINKFSKMKGSTVYYALPFMSSHFSQPINAGEIVWIFNDNGHYYWMSRKTSLSNIEDVNYASGLREFTKEDKTSERSNIDIANGVESESERSKPDFPIMTNSKDEDLLSLLNFYNSHASKGFVGEPVPIVKSKANEFVIQGSNNSSIKLSNNGYYNTGNIELTAGISQNTYSSARENDRGYYEVNRIVVEDQNMNEGDSDYLNDSSRIFISAGDDAVNKFIYGSSGADSESDEDDPTQFKTNQDFNYNPTIVSKTTDYFVITNSGGTIYLRNEGGTYISLNSSNINIIGDKITIAGTNDLEPATRSITLQNLLTELASLITEIVIPTAVGPAPVAGDTAFITQIQEWSQRLPDIQSISVEHD